MGAVLGRGGSTVAAIKRDTGAYVQFTRPGTATNSPKERMMIVAVENRPQLAKAMALIFEVLACAAALAAPPLLRAGACAEVATVYSLMTPLRPSWCGIRKKILPTGNHLFAHYSKK